jgi:nicotinamide mononucleotide transporter
MQRGFLAYQQIFGIALAIITISLDARENILARPLSLVGTIMAFFVYYPAGLYAKCLQSVVTICLNTYGWYQWSYGGKYKTPLQVSKTSPLTLLRLLLAGILGTVTLGSLLYQYSHADLPYWDSLHTVVCLTAQWMLVRKKLESWLLWVLADVLYTAVLYYKGLYLFSGLYLFFTFLAINGYRTWRQSYLKQTAAAVVGTSE